MAAVLELRGSASGFFVWYYCLNRRASGAMSQWPSVALGFVARLLVGQDTLVFLALGRRGPLRDKAESKGAAG
jgi:hypothetical protein